MTTRLTTFIDYATNGNKAEFARSVGWTPQYLSNLLRERSMGINPVVAVLERYPELNARWILLGEGAMLSTGIDALKQRLLYLLEIERYLPVMTAEEQAKVIAGDLAFDRETITKWHTLLAEKKASLNARFEAAYARQKQGAQNLKK